MTIRLVIGVEDIHVPPEHALDMIPTIVYLDLQVATIEPRVFGRQYNFFAVLWFGIYLSAGWLVAKVCQHSPLLAIHSPIQVSDSSSW